jgi:hypothetical protein
MRLGVAEMIKGIEYLNEALVDGYMRRAVGRYGGRTVGGSSV